MLDPGATLEMSRRHEGAYANRPTWAEIRAKPTEYGGCAKEKGIGTYRKSSIMASPNIQKTTSREMQPFGPFTT